MASGQRSYPYASVRVQKSPTSNSMSPKTMLAKEASPETLETAHLALIAAQKALTASPAGIARQAPFTALLDAERRCTGAVHRWFAEAFELQPVKDPRALFSLDVDGVLEDDAEGFSATNLAGVAALSLLQLGQVAVVLNTARSLTDVRQRADDFKLLGGVSSFGASVWDGVFDREYCLLSDSGAAEIDRVRGIFRKDPATLVDASYTYSVRISRMTDGRLRPITAEDARTVLDEGGLSHLAFWVAPRHTDFVDRASDKGRGVERLQRELGLGSIPLAAMGDAACDVPMFKPAKIAFVPAAALPSYTPSRRQRFMRSHYLGGQAVWEAACQLVPNLTLQRRVLSVAQSLRMPDWMPETLRIPPLMSRGLLPRIANALTTRR